MLQERSVLPSSINQTLYYSFAELHTESILKKSSSKDSSSFKRGMIMDKFINVSKFEIISSKLDFYFVILGIEIVFPLKIYA